MSSKPVVQSSPVVSRPKTLFGYKSEQIEFVGDVVAPVEVEWGRAAPRKRRPARSRRRS